MSTATNSPTASPRVGVIMGSDSDFEVMRAALTALAELGVHAEARVLSAHRTPDDTIAYARAAADRGLHVIIAGAGAAAHLAGVVAAVTPLPVIGVPLASSPLAGMDALLAIAQMPAGVPVATVAIGGARNAGLLAARIIALADPTVRQAVERFQADQADAVRAKDRALQHKLSDPAAQR